MNAYLILETIGFRMKRSGTTYILDAIELIKDLEPYEVMMNKYIYPRISIIRNTTEKAVESNMRESVLATYNCCQFKEIKEKYFKDKVPSNKEIILFLREFIKNYNNQ